MTNGKNGTGTGNGVHKDASIIGDHDLLWDGLSPAVTQKLSEPLDPSLVSRRKGRGNRSFAYVEGRTAIDQANRIFGFGGWGYEVVGEVALREIDNVDPKTGEVRASAPTPPRCGSTCRERPPAPTWASTRWPRRTARATKRPARAL